MPRETHGGWHRTMLAIQSDDNPAADTFAFRSGGCAASGRCGGGLLDRLRDQSALLVRVGGDTLRLMPGPAQAAFRRAKKSPRPLRRGAKSPGPEPFQAQLWRI
jgi:hypothetical protein